MMDYKAAANTFIASMKDIGDALRALNGSKQEYAITDVAAAIRQLQINGLSFYEYTGEVQKYIVPLNGTYQLECRGAGAADSIGGKGSKVSTQVALKKGDILYIYVGARYNSFNGGGESATASGNGATGWSSVGSGATDIRLIPSTENDGWSGTESLASRIITAGGGGAKGTYNDAGQRLSFWTDEYGYDRVSRVAVDTSIKSKASVSEEVSNNVLGKGSNASAVATSERKEGSGAYGDESATRYYVSLALAGGGGYYGGTNGRTGTSYVVESFEHNDEIYETHNTIYDYCSNGNDGYAKITYLEQPE